MGYRPDAFTDAYPDGLCAGVKLHYAVEPEPLDTAGAIRFAARDAGIDDRFVVVNGDVLTDLDLGGADRLPRRRTVPRAPSRCTESRIPRRSAWCRPTADGRVRGLRREAAAGRGADRPDQRRHLRARAVGARSHRGRPQGVDRARDVPGHGRRRRPVRPGRRHLLDRHRHPRQYLAGPARPARRPSRRPAHDGRAPRRRGAGGDRRAGGDRPWRRPSAPARSCERDRAARRGHRRRGAHRASRSSERAPRSVPERGSSASRSSATTRSSNREPSCTASGSPTEA